MASEALRSSEIWVREAAYPFRTEGAMGFQGSVTNLIERLGSGEADAARAIWERYFPRLIEIARAKLRGTVLRDADEEDVALSAIHTFLQAAARKSIPQLRNRDDLWRALVLITAGKAIDQRRRQLTRKRGGSVLPDGTRAARLLTDELAGVVGNEPDPRFAAQIAEEFESLLNLLSGEGLREIALSKLEGYSNEEIAAQIGCSERTITRRLTIIRRTWESASDSTRD